MAKTRTRITEKRLKNKRFKRTEDAIIRTFFEGERYNTVSKLAGELGMARSTFYNHHETIYTVIPEYRVYILNKYSSLMGRLKRKNGITIRKLYAQMLMFLLANRETLEIIALDDERTVITKMVLRLSSSVEKFLRLPKNSGKMQMVYTNEVVGLVEEWGKRGLKDDEMPQLINDIMFLTNTMRVRLAPLLD